LHGQPQFEDVIRVHQGFVVRTLVRLTGSREHVEDLTQEVFLRLYRGMDSFRGDAKLTTYLYRITLNVAQAEWKRRRKEKAHTSFDDPDEGWGDRLAREEADAEQILDRKQMISGLERALDLLSEVERQVIVMFHQEELTYEKIAEVLSLPLNTVRTHLHRGRKRLKERLREGRTACATTV
jgi:RNA polymerase sigma factor (sigma-70 family)